MNKQTTLIKVILFCTLATLSSTTLALFQSAHAILINTGDIANNAVTSPKIRDGEVKTPDMSNNAITTSKISDGAVEENDLADNSVTSNKIQDGSILAADLSPSLILGSSNEKLKDVSQILFNTCSIDFPSIPAQKVSFAFCPVTGVKIGDKVIITNQDTASDLLTQSASVNSTDLVKIAVKNPNFLASDPPKISWAMIIFRS
jgi:hypothetical protein